MQVETLQNIKNLELSNLSYSSDTKYGFKFLIQFVVFWGLSGRCSGLSPRFLPPGELGVGGDLCGAGVQTQTGQEQGECCATGSLKQVLDRV